MHTSKHGSDTDTMVGAGPLVGLADTAALSGWIYVARTRASEPLLELSPSRSEMVRTIRLLPSA